MEYRGWNIEMEERGDGWYYVVTLLPRQGFRATYGPFAGPNCTEASAKTLIDVLEENIEW